jgi:hypothetical protein
LEYSLVLIRRTSEDRLAAGEYLLAQAQEIIARQLKDKPIPPALRRILQDGRNLTVLQLGQVAYDLGVEISLTVVSRGSEKK